MGYLMAQDHHGSENLPDLTSIVMILLLFEQAYEHILQPVVVDLLVPDELLEYLYDACGAELPDSSLHQLTEFFLCLSRKQFISQIVVGQVNVFKVVWRQIVQIFFNTAVHFLPESLIRKVQFLHQEVKVHGVFLFYPVKILINISEGLGNPLMFVPVMLLLALDFGQHSESFDQFFKVQVLEVFKPEQHLVGLQMPPMYGSRVRHKLISLEFEDMPVADGNSNGERDFILGQIGRPDEGFEFELLGEAGVEFHPLPQGFYFGRLGKVGDSLANKLRQHDLNQQSPLLQLILASLHNAANIMGDNSVNLANLLAKYSSQPLPSQEFEQNQRVSMSQRKPNKNSPQIDEEYLDQCFDMLLRPQPNKQKADESLRGQDEESGRSAKNIYTPSKPQKKRRAKKQKEKEKLQFYNPYESLQFLNADKSRLINQLNKAESDQDKINEQALKLGLKPLKALGAAKFRREIGHIIHYLERGQLPQSYRQKLEALINS